MDKLHLIVLAIGSAIVGSITLVTTTGMSSSGLVAMFPDIQGIAFLGYAVALGAVVMAGIAAHMIFHKHYVIGGFCIILSVITIGSEFLVNDHSTGNTAHNQVAADSEATAKYNAALGRRPTLTENMKQIDADRKTIRDAKGSEAVKVAQRIMKNTSVMNPATGAFEPVYKGLIDGEEKGLTQEAMSQFAIWSEGRLTEIRAQQAADQIILDLGEPVVKDSGMVNAFAKFVALFATVFAALMFVAADLLLCFALTRTRTPDELVDVLTSDLNRVLARVGGDDSTVVDLRERRKA